MACLGDRSLDSVGVQRPTELISIDQTCEEELWKIGTGHIEKKKRMRDANVSQG